MSAGPAGPVPPERIVLTGFMGAGKSTVGRILAARLGWPFLDTDSILIAEHGCSIAQIFSLHGEPHFRRIEAEAVSRVLDPAYEHSHAVIGLGGGAIETEAVRRLLFPASPSVPAIVTIFLAAPIDELLIRCRPAASGRAEAPIRPLLAAPEPPEERLARRLPYYRRAHLTVETAGLTPDQVADHILAWLPSPVVP
ncbi:MAG TPA: shikimate kinase [Acidobacteriaceae bacterium]